MSKMRYITSYYHYYLIISMYSCRCFLFLLSISLHLYDLRGFFLSFFVCGGYVLQTSQGQTLSSTISFTHSTADAYLWYSPALHMHLCFCVFLFYVFLPLIPFIFIFHSVFLGTHLILGLMAA